MEIKVGDYVKYKGKVYSVAYTYNNDTTVKMINYKDLKILTSIHKSELEKLTDFHVSVMRYNKSLPPRRFKVGDRVKLRAGLDSKCFWGSTFRGRCFGTGEEFNVNRVFLSCSLNINNNSVHEFEVELVEGN